VNLRSVSQVLGAWTPDAEPVDIVQWNAKEATQSPTALRFTAAQQEEQQEGGTWSEMFDRHSLLNENQFLAVIVWWLLMMAVGWLAFPLLFVVFPGLPDHGFGAGKILGWMLVAWVAWFGGSLGVRLWTQSGLIALLIGWP